MKNNVARNCQSVFLFNSKLQFCFLTLIFNLSFSWPKTARVNVHNICNGDTEIIGHARMLQCKTRKTLSNYETWIKKLMHGKSSLSFSCDIRSRGIFSQWMFLIFKCIARQPNNWPGPISSLLTTELTSPTETLLSLLWILK